MAAAPQQRAATGWTCLTLVSIVAAGWALPLAAAPAGPAHFTSAGAEDWPQWRGPRRDATFRGPAWPERLASGALERVWRVNLGTSYSGPIVAGDRVFVTESSRKEGMESVRALRRQTGEELWRTEWPGTMKVPFFARRNGSWIRSTPATDGQALYVGGMCDVLVCLEAATGAIRWTVDFRQRYDTPLPSFGFVCSPLVIGDRVYVQAGASLVCLDTRTGVTIWRTLVDRGGMRYGAFSSPFRSTLSGVDQLLVQTRQLLAGVSLSDGTVLWQQPVKAFRGMNILTPTVSGDRVFTGGYGGRAQMLLVDRPDAGWRVTPIWNNKHQPYMSSPVLLADHVYVHLRDRRFVCMSLADGTLKWRSKERFGKYMSMVARGNRILALAHVCHLLT